MRRFWLTVIVAAAVVSPYGLPGPAKAASPAPGKALAKNATLPETIVIDTSEGRITLPHLAHAKRFHCNTCHSEIEPGKIAWDKDTAHAYCRDCHTKNGKGPITCAECHRK
jgi:hypothetical protein